MNRLSGFPLAGLVAGFAVWGPCAVAQTITTTPTFNNIGLVVDLAAPATQPVVRMFMKTAGAPTNPFREVHPLSGLTATRFAGSAFGHYQLQSTPDLFPPAWNVIGEPVQAERTRLQLKDPSPTGAQRFYRLQHVAP